MFDLAVKFFRRHAVSFWIILLTLVTPTSGHAGIRTCEEIEAIIAGYTYQASPTDREIHWPRSISKGSDFLKGLPHELEKLLESSQPGSFTGVRGNQMNFRTFSVPNSRGSIFIVHGIKESIPKWLEVIRTLNLEGYTVHIYEQRGHGHADRETSNHQVVHISDYADYVGDLKAFVETVGANEPDSRRFLLANSMGSLVATLYVNENPGTVDAMVALVPAYEINLKGIPKWVARFMIGVNSLIGRAKQYAHKQTNFRENKFRELTAPLDPDRVNHYFDSLQRRPMTLMGGPSNGWIGATLDATEKVAKIDGKFPTSILVVEAGQDKIVKSTAVGKFAAQNKKASHYVEPDAEHQVMGEKDSLRTPLVTEMLRYFVNPIRLDEPARRDELPHLFDQAKRYLQKKEYGFARYTLDEIERVLEWKKDSLQHEETTQSHLELTYLKSHVLRALPGPTVEEEGLYKFLSYQRSQELKKLYGKITP